MSYSQITNHSAMIFDGVRNAAYKRALEKTVRADSIVMDLGAGLGVHGFNAARLGAAEVHLVDPSSVMDITAMAARDNAFDNVYFQQCRAEELALEKRVDILVSVFTGNFMLTEDLLPTLFNARDRFLAPNGTMIPDRASMEAVPVSAADYYQRHVNNWSTYPEHAARYELPDLAYQAVRPYAANTIFFDSRENFDSMELAEPVNLMELDLTVAANTACDSSVSLTISRDGTCHGWLGWFEMRLCDEWLSTSGKAQKTHWSLAFMPLDQPLELKAGDELEFRLRRPERGEWTWETTHAGQRQRQSTFLSQALTTKRAMKASDNYRPKANDRGQAAQWLLAQMVGEASVGQLAGKAHERFPGIFASEGEALDFVKKLAGSFS